MRVLCVATGPSLTRAQIEWVNAQDCFKIAVNNACYLIPQPDVVLAADYDWWMHNNPPSGHRITCSPFDIPGVDHFVSSVRGSFSSGGRAIEYAVTQLNATCIELIGYDCSVKNGTHCHGDHGGGLKNPDAVVTSRWLDHYRKIAEWLPENVRVVNLSTYTEIPDDVFQRIPWSGRQHISAPVP